MATNQTNDGLRSQSTGLAAACQPGGRFVYRTHLYLDGTSCVRCGQQGKPRARVAAAEKVHLAGADRLPVCTQHDSSANTRDISKWVCTSNRDEVTCKVCRPHAVRRAK